jgi:hypothetical protein
MLDHKKLFVYRLVSFLYLAIVYSKGVLSKGAWLDDWGSLFDPKSVALHATRDGRPVYGWMIRLLFGNFDSLNSLFIIRIFGLLGLLLLSDFLIRQVIKINSSISVFIAVIFSFTIPAFQFSSHMANAFGFCWAIYLMLQGFVIYSQVNLLKKALGVCLGVLSLLTYPLMSFFIFPFVYFLWVVSGASFRVLFRNLLQVLGYFASSFVISMLSLKIYLFFSRLEFNNRVQLVSPEEIPAKIMWFITRPFLISYRPFLISSPTPLEAVIQFSVGLLLISICFFLRFKTTRNALKNLFLFNAVIVLSLTPLFFAAQNEIEIYFVLSSSWLFVILLVYFVTDFLFRKKFSVSHFQSFRSNTFVVVLLLTGFLAVNSRYYSNIRQIENSTFIFLSNQINRCSDAELNAGVSILPRTQDWPTKANLGVYSQTTDLQSIWVPVQAVRVILKDKDPIVFANPKVAWGEDENGGCVIDLNRF